MDLEMRAEVRGDVLVLAVQGELTSAQAANFKSWATAELEGGPTKVHVDCEKLHFIDSNGLGCLIYLRKCVVERDGQLTIINVSGWLRKFLQVTGLEEVFCGPSETLNEEVEDPQAEEQV